MAVIGAARQLHGAALRRGVLAGVVVVGPAAGASAWLTRGEEGGAGPGALALFAVVLVGFGVAGGATGRERTDLPFTHGAVAGLLTYGVVQSGVLVVSAVAGREGEVSIAALAANGLLAASAGMIGAMLTSRRGRQRH